MPCAECERKSKAMASMLTDLENAETDLRVQRRQLGALKAQVTKLKDPPKKDAQRVDRIIQLWRDELGHPRAKADKKRRDMVAEALALYDDEAEGERALTKAIRGLKLKPHAGKRGRAYKPYPGSKRFDKLEHAIGSARRIEDCGEYVDEFQRTLRKQHHEWVERMTADGHLLDETELQKVQEQAA